MTHNGLVYEKLQIKNAVIFSLKQKKQKRTKLYI
jgi:hypothetical protein